jgi:hypothetical protein
MKTKKCNFLTYSFDNILIEKTLPFANKEFSGLAEYSLEEFMGKGTKIS